MDGTVNWARREEGRVLRTGSCPGAGTVLTDGVATAFGSALEAALTAGAAGTLDATALAVLAGALAAAWDLLGSAFTSCLLAIRAGRES